MWDHGKMVVHFHNVDVELHGPANSLSEFEHENLQKIMQTGFD